MYHEKARNGLKSSPMIFQRANGAASLQIGEEDYITREPQRELSSDCRRRR